MSRTPRTGLGANPGHQGDDEDIYNDPGFDADEFSDDDDDPGNHFHDNQHGIPSRQAPPIPDSDEEEQDYLLPDTQQPPERPRHGGLEQKPSFSGRPPPPIPGGPSVQSDSAPQLPSRGHRLPPPVPAEDRPSPHRESRGLPPPPTDGRGLPPPTGSRGLPPPPTDGRGLPPPTGGRGLPPPPTDGRGLPPPPTDNRGSSWPNQSSIEEEDEPTEYLAPHQELQEPPPLPPNNSRSQLPAIQDEDVYLDPTSSPDISSRGRLPPPTPENNRQSARSSLSSRSSTTSIASDTSVPEVPRKQDFPPKQDFGPRQNAPRAKLPTPTTAEPPRLPPDPPQEEYEIIPADSKKPESAGSRGWSQQPQPTAAKQKEPWKFSKKEKKADSNNNKGVGAAPPLPARGNDQSGEVYEMFAEDQPENVSGGSARDIAQPKVPPRQEPRPRKTSQPILGGTGPGQFDINTQAIRNIKLRKVSCEEVFSPKKEAHVGSSSPFNNRRVPKVPTPIDSPQLPQRKISTSDSPQLPQRKISATDSPQLPQRKISATESPARKISTHRNDMVKVANSNEDDNEQQGFKDRMKKFEQQKLPLGGGVSPRQPLPRNPANTQAQEGGNKSWSSKQSPPRIQPQEGGGKSWLHSQGLKPVNTQTQEVGVKRLDTIQPRDSGIGSMHQDTVMDQSQWYHGSMDRTETQERLMQCAKNGVCANGTFLVRDSQRGGPKSPYTLCVYFGNEVKNLNIRKRDDSKFALGKEKDEEHAFPSVPELIEYHQGHPIIIADSTANGKHTPGGETVLITYPRRP